MWKGLAGAMALACVTGVTMPAEAQVPLTLERVFASPDLSGPQPQALRLSDRKSVV